jgi:hypothetical protein
MSRLKANASSTRQVASRLQDSRALTALARGGFAMNGLIHIVIGAIAVSIAFGGSGSADQGGALEALTATPAGALVLWVVVIGLWGLGVFQILEAALVRAVGFTAFTAANGGQTNSGGQTQSLSATLLATPGGVILLVVVALLVAGIGVYFVVKGAKQKFLEDIDEPNGTPKKAIKVLGIGGYIAKGVALVAVGGLFAVAAFTHDSSNATGLDGALKSLAELPFGVIILTAVGLGFVFYGVYCFVRAKYARL